VLSQLS